MHQLFKYFLSIFVYLVLGYISLFINFRFVRCIAVILMSYIKMPPDSNLEQRKKCMTETASIFAGY